MVWIFIMIGLVLKTKCHNHTYGGILDRNTNTWTIYLWVVIGNWKRLINYRSKLKNSLSLVGVEFNRKTVGRNMHWFNNDFLIRNNFLPLEPFQTQIFLILHTLFHDTFLDLLQMEQMYKELGPVPSNLDGSNLRGSGKHSGFLWVVFELQYSCIIN